MLMKNQTLFIIALLTIVWTSCGSDDSTPPEPVAEEAPANTLKFRGKSFDISHAKMRDYGKGEFDLFFMSKGLNYTRSIGTKGSGDLIGMRIESETIRELSEGTYINTKPELSYPWMGLGYTDAKADYEERLQFNALKMVVEHKDYGYKITFTATTSDSSKLTGEYFGEIEIF